MFIHRVLLGATLAALAVHAQTPQPRAAVQATAAPSLTFDVISVRQNKVAQGYRETMAQDGYSVTGLPFAMLIRKAYGIPTYYQIVGAPSWSNDNRYDIQAKVAEGDVSAFQGLAYGERMKMLRQVLTDRFKVKLHWETRTEPIYSLVIAKRGVLTETSASTDSPTESRGGSLSMGRGTLAGQMVARVHTMEWLADALSGTDDRMVVDNTGLTGHYTADLHWTRDTVPSAGDQSASDATITIFTALQEQLGLKLVPAKGPVQCLVIDYVETPSEN